MIFNSPIISLVSVSLALLSPIRSEPAQSTGGQKYKDIFDWKCQDKRYEVSPWKAEPPAEQKAKSDESKDESMVSPKADKKEEVTSTKYVETTTIETTTTETTPSTETTTLAQDATDDENVTATASEVYVLPKFGFNNYDGKDDAELSGVLQLTASSALGLLIIVLIA